MASPARQLVPRSATFPLLTEFGREGSPLHTRWPNGAPPAEGAHAATETAPPAPAPAPVHSGTGRRRGSSVQTVRVDMAGMNQTPTPAGRTALSPAPMGSRGQQISSVAVPLQPAASMRLPPPGGRAPQEGGATPIGSQAQAQVLVASGPGPRPTVALQAHAVQRQASVVRQQMLLAGLGTAPQAPQQPQSVPPSLARTSSGFLAGGSGLTVNKSGCMLLRPQQMPHPCNFYAAGTVPGVGPAFGAAGGGVVPPLGLSGKARRVLVAAPGTAPLASPRSSPPCTL